MLKVTRIDQGPVLVRALLITMAVVLAGCQPPVPDVLKIGVLTSLSGSSVARGKDMLDGAQLAADSINASGFRISGHPVRVEITAMDDKGDAEVARQGAQKLLDEGMHAIVGPILTGPTTAAVKVIAERGVPQLFTTTSTPLVGMGKGNTFRLLAHDDLQGRAMAMFTRDTLQAQRIGTITEAGDYGRGLEKAMTKALAGVGAKAVYAVEIGANADVLNDTAQALKDAHVDVIVLMARDPQLKSLLTSLQAVGFTDVTIVGSNAVRNKSTAKYPIPVRAVYATATAIDPQEFPAGKKFLDEFQNKFRADPVWGAHYAYDAVFAVADAARRAHSVQPADLVHKLKTIEPMTPINQQMRFNAQGEQAHASIGVYKLERAEWVAQMRSSIW